MRSRLYLVVLTCLTYLAYLCHGSTRITRHVRTEPRMAHGINLAKHEGKCLAPCLYFARCHRAEVPLRLRRDSKNASAFRRVKRQGAT
jgi:hypothetical protein